MHAFSICQGSLRTHRVCADDVINVPMIEHSLVWKLVENGRQRLLTLREKTSHDDDEQSCVRGAFQKSYKQKSSAEKARLLLTRPKAWSRPNLQTASISKIQNIYPT